MINAPRRHKHPSSCENTPSDVVVTFNLNVEFNLSLIWWQLTPWMNAFQGIRSPSIVRCDSKLESGAAYTAPPSLFESLPGHSNWSLPCLPLHLPAEGIIPTFLMWNIYIGQCLAKALTLTPHLSYEIFRNNKPVGLWGILIFPCKETGFRTGCQEGFLPWTEFHSLYTPRS